MILVDSSVWIDYFNGRKNLQTDFLHEALGQEIVCTGDLIMTEVLQGFNSDKSFSDALSFFEDLHFFSLGGKELAVASAQNFRFLRKKGITIRKTIDVVIATFCIKNEVFLLHSDKDFDPIVIHLGLKSVI
ncbi:MULTISPECIES: PIN domain nuclease [Algoriphagus]|uniref:PIN domain nuclease n=1 Tax=Algoriphagus aquimarinus TaxID=237018 RepID=A0A5C7AYS5_9BACT|nr:MULTISPECIES: PIN domain nuclease [Algoriphagus]MEB2784615.1 PIN domain nuclease [Algoriphagus sp. E1-3-M2]TXE12609.1 PIN domain nuclease [Algoriphagus aquimarinus]